MKGRILAFVLLAFPLTLSATPITFSWSGEIVDYLGTPDSGFPQPPLQPTLISGTISYDTAFLPEADAGSNAEFLSFSGADFITSSIQWAGGVFNPMLPGGSGSDVLQITNSDSDAYFLIDSSSVIDLDGRVAFLQFELIGAPDLFATSVASADSVPTGAFESGSNVFLNLNLLGDDGFEAAYRVTNVHTGVVNVPEPATSSLVLVALLALGYRLRRNARDWGGVSARA